MKKIDIKTALMKSAALGAGATASVMVNKIPVIGNQKPLIRGIAKVALGTLIPMLSKAKAGDIVTSFGDGMVAGGVNEMVSGIVPGVAGIGNLDDPDGLGAVGEYDEVGGDYADMGAIEENYLGSAYDNNSVYGVDGIGEE